MSLREKSSGGFQMYGYQAYRLPNCSTSLTNAMNAGPNQDDNIALMKLMVWTGSGPYGGFSICRNVNFEFPYATGSVTNKFVDYAKGPCGPGHYAAAMCSNYHNVMWSYINGYLGYATDGTGVNDCDSPYSGWVWTNDWHYFA